jgi:hypothetical protein
MNAYARTVSTSQERLDAKIAARIWQSDCAIVAGLKAKIMEAIEEAQALYKASALSCQRAHDGLPQFAAALDDAMHDYIRPMERAISETEPGEGPDGCPGMPRVI